MTSALQVAPEPAHDALRKFRATVLVADDDASNRSLARDTLDDEGYRVVVASGNEEAVALIEREVPDCIVLDVGTPDTDGFAVCERLRRLPGVAEVPILFSTVLRDLESFDRALLAGGDDYVTKPVRPTELVLRVESALQLRHLTAEVREQFDSLRRQRDGMVRLRLQKERLMAFVVHDLKNPLNTMDLHAQSLLRDPMLGEDARSSAGTIRVAARELNRMIVNLLDVSRAEEGKLAVHRVDVDLRSLVDSVTDDVAGTARGVSVQTALAAERVVADADLLRRTLANLVENAFRHAPSGTVVRVVSRQVAGATELRVEDAGVGIPVLMRERIFNPFVQLGPDDGPAGGGGRGLGLAFCRIAIEAHGGRIWAEDANPGATFVLRIPDSA